MQYKNLREMLKKEAPETLAVPKRSLFANETSWLKAMDKYKKNGHWASPSEEDDKTLYKKDMENKKLNEVLKKTIKKVTGVEQAEKAGKAVGTIYSKLRDLGKPNNIVDKYVKQKMKQEGGWGMVGMEQANNEMAKRSRTLSKSIDKKLGR